MGGGAIEEQPVSSTLEQGKEAHTEGRQPLGGPGCAGLGITRTAQKAPGPVVLLLGHPKTRLCQSGRLVCEERWDLKEDWPIRAESWSQVAMTLLPHAQGHTVDRWLGTIHPGIFKHSSSKGNLP